MMSSFIFQCSSLHLLFGYYQSMCFPLFLGAVLMFQACCVLLITFYSTNIIFASGMLIMELLYMIYIVHSGRHARQNWKLRLFGLVECRKKVKPVKYSLCCYCAVRLRSILNRLQFAFNLVFVFRFIASRFRVMVITVLSK